METTTTTTRLKSKTNNNLVTNIILTLVLLSLFACKSEKATGISGENNTENNVIIGDNNVISVEKHLEANTDNLPFTILVDNQFLNATAKEVEGVQTESGNKKYVEPRGEKLTYDIFYNKEQLKIHPKLNYLELYRDKGPIENRRDYSGGEQQFFNVQFPNLDFRVVNNSDETIFFERAEFKVVKSYIDPEPLIILYEYDDKAFTFYKESWGDLKNCYVNYDLYPIDETKLNYKSTTFHQKVTGINEDSYAVVDITNDLIANGFDDEAFFASGVSATNEKLEERLAAMGKYRPTKAPLKEEFDAFWDFDQYYNQVIAAGRIHYTWTNEKGKEINDYVNFKADVTLFAERGASGESSFQYRTMLKESGANYTVTETISQYLKPKDIDRFHYLVGAEKSSVHQLKVRLYYNSGKFIDSNPIELKVFFPRSSKKQMEALKKSNKKGNIKDGASGDDLYVWVHKLNMREKPSLDSKVLTKLNEGTKITFAGEISKEKSTISLRGNKYTDFFYKVTTAGGKTGWVHGGALR